MGPDDAAELSHGVRPADADARGDRGAFESADAFRPYDRVCGAGARDRHDQRQVFDNGAVDGDQDDVAYYRGCFDCCQGSWVSISI